MDKPFKLDCAEIEQHMLAEYPAYLQSLNQHPEIIGNNLFIVGGQGWAIFNPSPAVAAAVGALA